MQLQAEIIDWSKSRPLWQQDALRRIAEESVGPADLKEITGLALQEYGLSDGSAGAIPLAERYSDARIPGERVTVWLAGIGDMVGVNALVSSQPISISSAGLTVIYGDNGAGKSGYVRVLKQACRARGHRSRVFPNVYAPPTEQSATISYRINEEPRTYRWKPDGAPANELREVSIFDSKCAPVYISDDSDVAYLPLGLDLFPKLSRICDYVRNELERELSAVMHSYDKWTDFEPGTMVYQCLQRLQGTYTACKSLAALSEQDAEMLARLRSDRDKRNVENPAARAMELRHSIRRVNEIIARCRTTNESLTNQTIEAIRNNSVVHAAALEAAAVATAAAFSDVPVQGIGSHPWRALWESARSFAQQAVPPQGFPPQEGALCMLCMQQMTQDSQKLLARFEEFVLSDLQRKVELTARELQDSQQIVKNLAPENVASGLDLDFIGGLKPKAADGLASAIRRMEERRELCMAGDYGRALQHTTIDPTAELEVLLEELQREAVAFEAAAHPVDEASRDAELRELEARETLRQEFVRVDDQLKREIRARKLRDAIASASTMTITKFSKDLLETAVTAPLAEAFASQCNALRLDHLPISLDGVRGEKGNAVHRVSLHHQIQGVDNSEILSEGELRCVALAAFLAEILVQSSQSTIILDDPVSSLDHGRRAHVARQLGAIATARPVVVFTHDLVFLWMLQEAAEKVQVGCTHWSIIRTSRSPGHVYAEPPWDGLNLKRRIGILKDATARLTKVAERDPLAYEAQVRILYGRLRSSWERAVEELLLQGAIMRFSPEIKTQSLKKLHRITDEQLAALDEGMTKASSWIEGHDHAAGLGASVPPPNEVIEDVLKLEEWASGVRKTYS